MKYSELEKPPNPVWESEIIEELGLPPMKSLPLPEEGKQRVNLGGTLNEDEI